MKTYFVTLACLLVNFAVLAQSRVDTLLSEIGIELEEGFYLNSDEVFQNYFDADLFVSSFLIEDSTDIELTTFNSAIRDELPVVFISAVLREVENGAYYNFVNFDYDAFGNYYLLFRLFSEGGLNYHEYLLSQNEEGDFVISDIYIYLTGEYLSESMSRYYLAGATKLLNEELYEKEDFRVLDYSDKIQQIQQLLQWGRKDMALEIYKEIPEEVRKEKTVRLYALQLIDSESQEEEYSQILEEYLKDYPEDPSLYLVSIDHYVIKEDYAKAQAMIDTLGMLTNDSFLYFLQGNMEYLKGKLEKAEEHYQFILTEYPGFLEAYNVMLGLYIEQKRYGKGVDVLRSLGENFEVDRSILDEMVREDFPEFAASPQYQNWKNE
jgi:tetratricopeptide (TPR) repeat protein